MEWKYLIASLVYSLVGIVVLGLTFWFFEKITPENLWKEILEKQNLALAIVAAALMISLSIIISSAIHG
jgi:putative membrane protein